MAVKNTQELKETIRDLRIDLGMLVNRQREIADYINSDKPNSAQLSVYTNSYRMYQDRIDTIEAEINKTTKLIKGE